MAHPILVSIQVGMPRIYGKKDASDPFERAWESAIIKLPVEGPIELGRTHFHGDQQADLKHHGGPDKAALAYSADHYPAWRKRLGISDLPFGGFGENFTIAGLSEESVCIGDVFSVGDARVQVSQPRSPCWKLSRRWGIKDLSAQVEARRQGGWYFRVLMEGSVERGVEVVLRERLFPQWTVAHTFALMHHQKHDLSAAAELAACPLLSATWRQEFAARMRGETPS